MINVSDGYGDVLKNARLSFDGRRTAFEYQGTVKTVFANPSSASACGLACAA